MFLKNLPTILSLLAGFIVCVTTYVYEYDGVSWLLILSGTLLLFYILGLCLSRLFTVVLSEKQTEDTTDEEIEEMGTEAEDEDYDD